MPRRRRGRRSPRLSRKAESRRRQFPCRESRHARRANGRIRPLQPGPARPSEGRRAHIASRIRRGPGPGRGVGCIQRGSRRSGIVRPPLRSLRPSSRLSPTPHPRTAATRRSLRLVTSTPGRLLMANVTSLSLPLPARARSLPRRSWRLRSRPSCRPVARRAAPPAPVVARPARLPRRCSRSSAYAFFEPCCRGS
jgi:hypothetical protein